MRHARISSGGLLTTCEEGSAAAEELRALIDGGAATNGCDDDEEEAAAATEPAVDVADCSVAEGLFTAEVKRRAAAAGRQNMLTRDRNELLRAPTDAARYDSVRSC